MSFYFCRSAVTGCPILRWKNSFRTSFRHQKTETDGFSQSLQPLCDRVSVQRTECDYFQDQQVQGAVKRTNCRRSLQSTTFTGMNDYATRACSAVE